MSKTTNKFAPEVLAQAIRMVLDHAADYLSRWATVVSIAEKIGCSPPTLHEWAKKGEVDSGKRACVSSDTAEMLKALERENRELRQANEMHRKPVEGEMLKVAHHSALVFRFDIPKVPMAVH